MGLISKDVAGATMPDRIIRDELMESERWLSLKDNADRLAYVALLLRADSLGNFTADHYRLMRMWRDFGINTLALTAKTVCELFEHDLIRLYEVDEKKLLHIPRFNTYSRYLSRIYPLSPWTTDQQKQLLTKYSHSANTVLTPCAPTSIGKERKGKESKSIGAHAAFDSFEVTEPMADWATKQGLKSGRVMPETTKFFDHHVAKGTSFKNWDAAWRNWMRNAVSYQK